MGTHRFFLFILFIAHFGHLTNVHAQNVEETLLPTGSEEKSIVVTFGEDPASPLNLGRQHQAMVLSRSADRRATARASEVLLDGGWFVVGLAGSNRTSLSKLSLALRLLPRHVIVLERRQGPSEEEMDLQNRQLIWKKENDHSRVTNIV